MATIILISILTVFVFMTVCWIGALIKKRNDIADVAWGLGFIVLTVVLFLQSNTNLKTYVLLFMVMVWGIRLAVHIGLRHRGKPEDKRYAKMREGWKYKTLQSYTHVFLTQGFFLLLVGTPIMLFFLEPQPIIQWYNWVGLIIWGFGFLYEAISDYQLTKFIKNPLNKGTIMRYGLWRYTRHPNYFGEITSWWGLYVFTLFTPFWYLGIIGPITITLLILGVSGIPMLEKHYEGNSEYDEYKKTTSAFFPLPPKS